MFSLLCSWERLVRLRAMDCSSFWMSAISLGLVNSPSFPYCCTYTISRSRLPIFFTSRSFMLFDTFFFSGCPCEERMLFSDTLLREGEHSGRKRSLARSNSLRLPLVFGEVSSASTSTFSYSAVSSTARSGLGSSSASGASTALKSSWVGCARSSVLSRQCLICAKVGRSSGLNSSISRSISPSSGSYIWSTLSRYIPMRVSSILRPNSGEKSMRSAACSRQSPKMNTSDLRMSTSLYSSSISGEWRRELLGRRGSSAMALGSSSLTLWPRKMRSQPSTPQPMLSPCRYSSALTTLYMMVHSSSERKQSSCCLRIAISSIREGREYWQMLLMVVCCWLLRSQQCCRVSRY